MIRMEETEISGGNFHGEFNTLICEEDAENEERLPHPFSEQERQKVSVSSRTRYVRPAAGILVLLAAALLVVDIGLGVHYSKLTDVHLTLDDTERIGSELIKLQDTYKAAFETMTAVKKQVDMETNWQKQTNWEMEHQTIRTREYETKTEEIRHDIAVLKSHMPMWIEGCKHCPEGWILMNSWCYYFKFADYYRESSWYSAREFCQMYGGDLAIIDSKDKQNSTVLRLLKKLGPRSNRNWNSRNHIRTFFFWIGLTYEDKEEMWKWVNGTELAEGYWSDGEPNYNYRHNCATVHPEENFFKTWTTSECDRQNNWICGKAPTIKS